MHSCKMLNLAALEETQIQSSPFPYTVISNFIHEEYLDAIQADYPIIKDAGSFPLSSVQAGKVFTQLMQEMQGEALRAVIANKLQMDLTNKPTLVTVRGRADHRDGRIHSDSVSKLVTLLLYMNQNWENSEGRLRLLYDNKNLDHYAAEIPPTAGTLLLFKNTPHGWHGHYPFVGTRKVIQLNYVTNEAALMNHQTRHRFSAKIKQWTRRFIKKSEY